MTPIFFSCSSNDAYFFSLMTHDISRSYFTFIFFKTNHHVQSALPGGRPSFSRSSLFFSPSGRAPPSFVGLRGLLRRPCLFSFPDFFFRDPLLVYAKIGLFRSPIFAPRGLFLCKEKDQKRNLVLRNIGEHIHSWGSL